jgi:hypothetical protein
MHQSQARTTQASSASLSIPPEADSRPLLRILPPPVERDLRDPKAQVELANRVTTYLEGQSNQALTEELWQATDRLVSSGVRSIPLERPLEEALLRGLQTPSLGDMATRVLLRAHLSPAGILALADAAKDRKGRGKSLAISIAEGASPQEEIFLGAGADALFEAVTSSFYMPRGLYVEQSLEHHGSFINARFRHLSARYQADPNDACLTALAETALFVGRCLRPTVRCRAAESMLIASKLDLLEPLRKATLDGASGLYGSLLRVVSCGRSDANRIAFFVHKLPREKLLACMKRSLSAHFAAKQALEAAL